MEPTFLCPFKPIKRRLTFWKKRKVRKNSGDEDLMSSPVTKTAQRSSRSSDDDDELMGSLKIRTVQKSRMPYKPRSSLYRKPKNRSSVYQKSWTSKRSSDDDDELMGSPKNRTVQKSRSSDDDDELMGSPKNRTVQKSRLPPGSGISSPKVIFKKAGFQPENCGEPKGESVEDGAREAYRKAESWIRESEYNCCTIESNNVVKLWEAIEPQVKLQKTDKGIIFMYRSPITVEYPE